MSIVEEVLLRERWHQWIGRDAKYIQCGYAIYIWVVDVQKRLPYSHETHTVWSIVDDDFHKSKEACIKPPSFTSAPESALRQTHEARPANPLPEYFCFHLEAE